MNENIRSPMRNESLTNDIHYCKCVLCKPHYFCEPFSTLTEMTIIFLVTVLRIQ